MEVFIMSKKNKRMLSPEDRLMRAIYGKPLSEVTDADVERLRKRFPKLTAKIEAEQDAKLEAEIEEAVNSVTDEDFQKMCGCTIEESTHRTMLFAGWCEAITKWNMEHGNDRQYHVFEFEPRFSVRQVCDMAQLFYRQGREDGKNRVSEYDRLWKLNRQDNIKGISD